METTRWLIGWNGEYLWDKTWSSEREAWIGAASDILGRDHCGVPKMDGLLDNLMDAMRNDQLSFEKISQGLAVSIVAHFKPDWSIVSVEVPSKCRDDELAFSNLPPLG